MIKVRDVKRHTNSKLFLALGGIILIASIAAIAIVLSITGLLHNRQAAQRHNNAHVHLEALLSGLETAEADQRGYLLAGGSDDLAAYRRTAAGISGQLKALAQESAGLPYHADTLGLQPLVQTRLDQLATGIQLHDSGDQAGVTAYVQSGQERALMDQIRARTAAIEQVQTGLIAQGRQRIEGYANLARAVSAATLALTLALAGLVYYLYVRALQAARELDQAKDEFVALASHQLRTPATGIKSILSTLIAGDLGPLGHQQKHFLTKALESNSREINIIDELLTVARADAGRLVLRPSEVELAGIVSAVAAEQRGIMRDKHLSLRIKQPAQPITLMADKEKIFMAIGNLLDNARKYTPANGTITITTRLKRAQAVIEVADTGIGIEEAEIAHIFDRFARARNALRDNIEGTGLGLYLVHQIIELHNGAIEVSSKKGQGSRFIMTLPLRRA